MATATFPLIRFRRHQPFPPSPPRPASPLRRPINGREADDSRGGETGRGGADAPQRVRERRLLLQPQPRGALHQDLALRRADCEERD